MDSGVRAGLRRGAALTAAAVVVLAGAVVVTPGAAEAADPRPSVPLVACDDLLAGGSCTFRAGEVTGDHALIIPDGVTRISILVMGGQGGSASSPEGNGQPNAAGGGGGGRLGTIDVSSTNWLEFELGTAANGSTPGTGFSDGGKGSRDSVTNGDAGGGGGGSSAVWYPSQRDDPFLVGGGGGGGGQNEWDSDRKGGGGGPGGMYPSAGASGPGNTILDSASGGAGGGASGPDGAPAEDFVPIVELAAGGGGGGGGWPRGGGAGSGGEEATDINGSPLTSAAGGGGGGSSYGRDGVFERLWNFTNNHGDGFITFFAGWPDEITGCRDVTYIEDDESIAAYQAIVVGAAGTTAAQIGPQGRGGATLASWTNPLTRTSVNPGCYGGLDNKGTAAGTGDDGGSGGESTLVSWGEGFVESGGGGGGGGNGGTFTQTGGTGGDGNGVDGSARPQSGVIGGQFKTLVFWASPGDAGCGGCQSQPGAGVRQGDPVSGGGGGGGGGDGARAGGGGGDGIGPPLVAGGGGGGGAGSSAAAPGPEGDAVFFTDETPDDGYVLLWRQPASPTTLTITKQVTGAGSTVYGTGPWAARVECADGAGDTRLSRTVPVALTTPTVLTDVLEGWVCTVTETDTGGASAPAGPQTTDPLPLSGATVALSNGYATAQLFVQAISRQSDGAAPSWTLPDVAVHVACTLDGRSIVVPDTDDGRIAIDGESTKGPDGAQVQIAGLPSGASCLVTETNAADGVDVTYDYLGDTTPTPTPIVVTSTATVTVANTYVLTTLGVTKTVEGLASPPAFAVGASCTFLGSPVRLPVTTLGLAAGETTGFPDVPVGADCTLEETDPGGADAVVFSPGATVHVLADGSTVVGILNRYVDAPLTISVQNAGPGAAWANVPYTVTGSCDVGGQQRPFAVTGIPAGGGSQTVGDVPEGASCIVESVSETGRSAPDGGVDDTLYGTGASGTWFDAPVEVVVDADGATLRIRALYQADRVDLSTRTAGPGAPFSNRNSVTTFGACTFNGVAVPLSPATPAERTADYTFGPRGGDAVTTPIVRGAVCAAVQRVGNGATATSTAYSPQDGARQAVIVGPDSYVAVTNTFATTSLAVTVTNAGRAAWAANTPTAVTVTCSFNGLALATVGAGGVLVVEFEPDGSLRHATAERPLDELPVGAVCSTTQGPSGGATRVDYAPASAPTGITLGRDPATVVVTDVFAGAAITTITAVGGNDAARHANDEFAFAQSCTFNGIVLDDPPTTPAWQGFYTEQPGPSRAVAFDGLPVGAVCRIEMVDDSHATGLSPGAVQDVTIARDGNILVFTASFDVATVRTALRTTGPGADFYAGGDPFRFALRCRYGDDGSGIPLGSAGQFTLTGPDAYQDVAVPIGATCRLATDEHAATSAVFDGETLVRADEVNSLSATYDYLLTELAVAKRTPGTTSSERFGFTAGCSWSLEGGTVLPVALETGRDAFRLASGGSTRLVALRSADCTVTETDRGTALSTTVDVDGRSVGGTTATVLLAADRQQARFDNAMPGALPRTGPAVWAWLAAVLGVGSLAGGAAILARRRVRRP